jgi:cell division protease FtsH
VNEAAILAARRNKHTIGMAEFEEAVEKVVAGPERKSRLISPKERKIIAYHEAGHAVVMHHLPLCDPVHKVSIVARGMSLGYTMGLPEEDRYLRRKAKFEDEMAGLLGGRAAEELIFDDVTTGASNDLDRVTGLARTMVTRYGMSDRLGPLTFGNREELVFLGREIGEQRNYSEEVAGLIDEEVHKLVSRAHDRARTVLIKNRDKLNRLAERLVEVETVDRAEFEALMSDDGSPLRPPEEPDRPLPTPPGEKTPVEDAGDIAGSDLQLKPMPA